MKKTFIATIVFSIFSSSLLAVPTSMIGKWVEKSDFGSGFIRKQILTFAKNTFSSIVFYNGSEANALSYKGRYIIKGKSILFIRNKRYVDGEWENYSDKYKVHYELKSSVLVIKHPSGSRSIYKKSR